MRDALVRRAFFWVGLEKNCADDLPTWDHATGTLQRLRRQDIRRRRERRRFEATGNFSFITMNWRGKPLRAHPTVVSPIAAAITDTGREIRSDADAAHFEKGRSVTDAEMSALSIRRHGFHGGGVYPVKPRVGDA
jgi:hypothetical protein